MELELGMRFFNFLLLEKQMAERSTDPGRPHMDERENGTSKEASSSTISVQTSGTESESVQFDQFRI